MMFGGDSSEHEISLFSAKNVYSALNKDKYKVLLGYIDRAGTWWLIPEWSDTPDSVKTDSLAIVPGRSAILTTASNEMIDIDAIFPVLHGKNGEDGTIQGLAELAHIPIVGCGVESSAVCMDKHVTKLLIEAYGLPVVPWQTVTQADSAKQCIAKAKQLTPTGPWFVKPSRAGSSVGVTKVSLVENIPTAVTEALQHDNLVLIETAVQGRELEVAVLGNVPTHKASGVGEIIAGNDFYDYDDKYSADSKSKIILDAKLPTALTKVIRQHALNAYETLGCRGLARMDFLLSEDLIPYINEVNTMPGFTDISMFPKLWNKKGMSYEALVERLIELAFE